MLTKRFRQPSLRLWLALAFVCCTPLSGLGRSPAIPAGEKASPSFDALAKSAAIARDAGNTSEAIRDYQGALALRPDWREGLWFLGSLQYDANQYLAAIATLQKLVQLAPGAGPAWNLLGLCEFETKDYANSLAHLEKGSSLGAGNDPEVTRVSAYHIALLRIRNGEFESGSAVLVAAFANAQLPDQVIFALGLAVLRVPLLPEEVNPSRDALLQSAGEAAELIAQGDTPKALAVFQKLLQDYPETPYLHYAFGNALAATGRLAEATAQHQAEEKVSPASALPLIQIAELQLGQHYLEGALRAAEKAIRLDPASAAAHQVLSESLHGSGKGVEAERESQKASSLFSKKPSPEQRIATLYGNRLSAENGPDSVATTPVAGNFDKLSSVAAAAEAAGNTEAAIQSYRQALQARPEWDVGHWNLAMLYYKTGHYPEAVATLKEWVVRKPDDGTAWAVMGLSEFEVQDYSNALVHLQRGQDLGAGGSADSVQLAKYCLAVLLTRDGRFEEATELLAPVAGSGILAKETVFVLGMAMLRVPLLPNEVVPAKTAVLQEAGAIALLLQNSKYDDAFQKFKELLKQYPSTPYLHYAYGTGLIALSQYGEAETQMREELKISPASELPYVRLASVALRQRRPGDALPNAQHAVQLAASSAEAHYLLGRSYLELGQQENAVHELEQASKLAPGSPEVHFNLAKAYAKAKLPERAEQERAIFIRLNALAEQQRSRTRTQSYAGPHDSEDVSVTPTAPNSPAAENR